MKISTILLIALAFVSLSINHSKLLAKETIEAKYISPAGSAVMPTVAVENLKNNKDINRKQGNINFIKFDSLANTYSYGNMMTNKAIKYDAQSGTLVTVKRGFVDNDRYPSYTGDNNKNNLFLRKSTDWGLTWDAPQKVYDVNLTSKNEARYPSVATFSYEGKLAVAYNASRVIEKQSIWTGHIVGFWNEEYGGINVAHSNAIPNRNTLEWGIDSRILAQTDDTGERIIQFSVGRVSPIAEEDTFNANHMGWRRVSDLSDESIEMNIPEQWASNKFRTTAAGYRSNELVDLKEDAQGNYYFAVFGGFANISNGKNSFGVSKSTDKGTTWTEFNVMPWQVAENFIVSKGHPADSANFYYQNKGFVVFDNGDYSFISKLTAWGTGETISYILEFNYSASGWKVYEIAQETTGWITYSDITDANGSRTNPNDNELDVARTIDGNTLIVKWVELIGYEPVFETFETTDVFVSTRKIGTTTWSEKQNITNSTEIDRMTLLPDLIPNDLTNIPLFKMVSVWEAEATEQEQRNQQFYGLIDQWLMVGHFNAFVGVEDEEEPCDCKNLEIRKLSPNPINENAIMNLVFWMPKDNKADISIYDANGKLIDDLKELDKEYKYSMNTTTIDLSGKSLATGSYYINIVSGGETATKLFNIVR